MNTERFEKVTEAIRGAASDAEVVAGALPPPDVEELLRRAHKARTNPAQWVIRSAAAAAVLAAAVGTLLAVRPSSVPDGPLQTGPIPGHIVAMVDALYPESDYVHDELADMLWPRDAGRGSGYLDEVWNSVISDITDS